MIESGFWANIRKHLSPEVHASRIENMAISGVPDVNLCRHGVDVWMELKIRKGRKIEVRYSQINWLRARLAHGARNIWYAVYSNEARRVELYPGQHILLGSEGAWGLVYKGKESCIFDPGYPSWSWDAPVNWTAFEEKLFDG